jgi:hypothetical protein
MFKRKARKKNRTATRIFTYVRRCGWQRNPDFIGIDKRFVKPSALSGNEGAIYNCAPPGNALPVNISAASCYSCKTPLLPEAIEIGWIALFLMGKF